MRGSTRFQFVSIESKIYRVGRIAEGTNGQGEGIGGKTELGRGAKTPLSEVYSMIEAK